MLVQRGVKFDRKQVVLTLVAVLFLAAAAGQSQEDQYSKSEMSLRRVLDSMTAALDFMAAEHNRLNLDAVIGLRLVEGQLSVLLKHLLSPGNHRLAKDIVLNIQKIREVAGVISNKALPYIEQHQADYYKRIGFIIQKDFWNHDYPGTDVDMELVERPLVIGEAMHEAESDKCLEELRTDRKSTNYECELTPTCWNQMTGPGYRYYSLSHEVFYLQIGEATGCLKGETLERTEKLRNKFCANMLSESRSFSNEGYPSVQQDLFMEEAALCGIYGFRQFFTEEWMDKILSWQRIPRGCWGMTRDDYIHGRTKREERVLPDGCECHRTAVALGALTQYVRYIVDYMQGLSGFDFF